MKKALKNKWIVIGIVVIILIVVGVIVYANILKNKQVTPKVATTPEEQAITMQASDIGLTLTPINNNHVVEMKIADVSKFNSYDYQMNYNSVVNGQTVPQGAIGSGDVKPGATLVDQKITIGTCSAVCRYDKGVTKVSFIIRLNLKNGKTGVVNQDLSLTD